MLEPNEKCPGLELEGGKRPGWQDDGGLLAAGGALARRISAAIGDERAALPAAKRTSQVATFFYFRLRSGTAPVGADGVKERVR